MSNAPTRIRAVLVAVLLLAVTVLASGPVGASEDGGASASDVRSSTLSPRLQAVSAPGLSTASAAVQANAAGLPVDGPGSLLRGPDGQLLVEVRVSDASAGVLRGLEARGGEIVHDGDGGAFVTVAVAPTSVRGLAAHPAVVYVSEINTPITSATGGDAAPGGGAAATCPTGVLTEGDAMLNADDLRTAEGLDGSGVRVGVLSDSYDNLGGAATDVADGEQPGVSNTCGHTDPVVIQSELSSGGSDEGRAMAQIVHDLAPGAELAFATAFNGESDFAQQVRNLATNGADVIVDDVFYFAEPMFQDGVIAKAMTDVVAAGVPVFTSAGNANETVGGKSVGSYEAPAYRPTTCPAGIPAYNDSCHDFDPGAGTTAFNAITVNDGGRIRVILGSDQPQLGVTMDADLYLVDSTTGSVVAASEIDNASSGRTFEMIDHTNATGGSRTFNLVVGRYNGGAAGTPAIKLIHQNLDGVTALGFDTSASGDVFGPTLTGHSAAAAPMSVAAIPYYSSTSIESFSSRGPSRQCWGPVDGGTPASALSPCTETTVDLAATDGGKNSFFGSFSAGTWRFFGTSAAAPHAAAVAALLREAAPCRTGAEVVAAMQASAVDIGKGVDAQGAGRVDALAAHSALAPCTPPPTEVVGTVTEDGSGDPLAGISVRLLTTGSVLEAVATTAADGTYTFADPPVGDHLVRFIDPSGTHRNELFDDSRTLLTVTPITVTSGATTTADASLAISGGDVKGQVKQQGSGVNLQGISVRLLTTSNVHVATRVTAADGRYLFRDVPEGDYLVRFIDLDDSHVDEYHLDAAVWTAATPVSVVMNTATVVDAQLAAATTGDLVGTVTEDGSGDPLPGISVRLLTPGGSFLATRDTRADGTYSFFDVAPGDYVVRFIDLDDSHVDEWHLDAANLAGATTVTVTVSASTTVDAGLAVTPP